MYLPRRPHIQEVWSWRTLSEHSYNLFPSVHYILDDPISQFLPQYRAHLCDDMKTKTAKSTRHCCGSVLYNLSISLICSWRVHLHSNKFLPKSFRQIRNGSQCLVAFIHYQIFIYESDYMPPPCSMCCLNQNWDFCIISSILFPVVQHLNALLFLLLKVIFKVIDLAFTEVKTPCQHLPKSNVWRNEREQLIIH